MGRKGVEAGIAKDRKRKAWKKTRKWPEKQLKGRILERTDKYTFRQSDHGYIDMNKVRANFPAVDGIANGQFRQVKSFMSEIDPKTKTMKGAINRIVAEAEMLEDKSTIAAKWLLKNNASLLREILLIDEGESGTKGLTDPSFTDKLTKRQLRRHMNVLPEEFRTAAEEQIQNLDEDEDFEPDEDLIASLILENIVLVVPDDLVESVKAKLKEVGGMVAKIPVTGGGATTQTIKKQMKKIGYEPSRTKVDEDEDEYTE